MRNYILTTILLLSTATLYGQTISLGPENHQYYTPPGSDTVPVLIETYTVQKKTQAPNTLNKNNIQKSAAELHPHILTQASVSTDKLVGEIPLQHQVTASGATTYNIPIECIPGRNGTQPAISITYNNLGGNGVLGYGWAIGGLSVISRTTSSVYYEGQIKPIDFGYDGALVLDGKKMLRKSSFGGGYGLELENAHIKDTGSWIEVYFPNKSKGYYGNNTSPYAKNLFYPLNEFIDALGNGVRYEYIYSGGQYLIKKITYGYNHSRNYTPFATIDFNYKDRDEVERTYVYQAGIRLDHTMLLDNIICKNKNETIRTYQLHYQHNGQGTLLEQVSCILPDGELNPLKFYYGTDNPQTEATKTQAQLTQWFSNTAVENLALSKGKFDVWSDNDALIAYPNLHPYAEVYVPPGTFNHSQRYYQNMFNPKQKLLVYPDINSDFIMPFEFEAGEGFMELTSADIDGIPGDEIIKINNRPSLNRDQLEFRIYKPTGIGGYAKVNEMSFGLMASLDYRDRKSITRYK